MKNDEEKVKVLNCSNQEATYLKALFVFDRGMKHENKFSFDVINSAKKWLRMI